MPSYNDALREEIIAILKSNDIAFKPFGACRTKGRIRRDRVPR